MYAIQTFDTALQLRLPIGVAAAWVTVDKFSNQATAERALRQLRTDNRDGWLLWRVRFIAQRAVRS